MNIISDAFGVFQGNGLVQRIKEQKNLGWFIVIVFCCIIVFTALYGLAMGISTSLIVAVRNSIKVPLIFILTFIVSYPAYFIPMKIVGVKETNQQILASMLTMFFVASLTLAIAAPIIFFHGLSSTYLKQYYFIHLVIIDLALLAGLIVTGFLLNKLIEIDDKGRLVVPVIFGTIFLGLALWVIIMFWGPYFEDTEFFSRGIKRIYELYSGYITNVPGVEQIKL